MPKYVNLKITDCRQCPFSKEKRIYTGDSFENVMDVFCTKTDRSNNKCGGYETFDKHQILPDWCPLIKTRKKS